MRKIINVNRHIIAKNKTDLANYPKKIAKELIKPPFSVKTYKSNEYGYEIQIDGPAKLVYRPNKPLPCGATVWIESNSKVEIIKEFK